VKSLAVHGEFIDVENFSLKEMQMEAFDVPRATPFASVPVV